MINAGILDRKITIEQQTVVRSTDGGETITWSTYKTVWAAMRNVRQTERLESDRQTASRVIEWSFRTLDAPLTDESMRIGYAGGIYEIEGVALYGRDETTKVTTKLKV